MRYKLLLFVALLLLATPLRAQEISALIVETLKTTTPTVVKTGEPFEQTYKIRFLDLTEWGEEVVIREESLNLSMLGDFEVLNFDSAERRVEERGGAKEHIWFLKYTLRIVHPEKKGYKIPSLTIPWVLKKIGQQDNDPSLMLRTNIRTDEVHVSYVTTITLDPFLNIRDRIDFGDYHRGAAVLRWISRGLTAAALFLVWMVISLLLKRPKNMEERADADADQAAISYTVSPRLSLQAVRRNLRQVVRRMKKANAQTPAEVRLEIAKAALAALKSFLKVNLPRAKIGSTPLDLLYYVEHEVKSRSKRIAYLALAKTVVAYQADVDGNQMVMTAQPALEAKRLRGLLRGLRWYGRLGSGLTHLLKQAFRPDSLSFYGSY